MKQIVKLFSLIVLFAVSYSCVNKDNIYTHYYNLPVEGWSKDIAYTFDVEVEDTSSLYNLYINIRNVSDYPYQNLWLFLDKIQPPGVEEKDTIELYLADQYGKWLGNGSSSVFEMPVLYLEDIRFPRAGVYRYSITHGMREDVLKGISDLGIRVERARN